MDLSFETSRLFLNPAKEEHAPFFLELYNTPKWIQFIGDRNVHTIADAEEWIRTKMFPSYHRLGYGTYVAVRKSDQVIVGTAGLYDRAGIDGIDLGFALLPEYEGQGYAHEAALKIRDAAFELFSLPKLSAITTVANFSSQKLLEKLGFIFQNNMRIPHDDAELKLYELKASDLKSAAA